MLSDLRTILDRDIDGLRVEIECYPDDASVWREVPGCPNSGGTLALHAVGNLRHYIGAQLGESGYVRDRPAEFGRRDVSRSEIVDLISAARSEVEAALAGLDDAALSVEFPQSAYGRTLTTRQWLLHLSTHLAYHLGQLDYHRRAVTQDGTGVGVVSLERFGDRV